MIKDAQIDKTLHLLRGIRKLVFSKMVPVINSSITIIEALNEDNKQLREELAALKEGKSK